MLNKLKSLASDSMIYGASSALGQVINLLLLPLYTHYLTKADFGVWAMLNIVLMMFLPLSGLGMTNAVFRRFNTCKDDEERQVVLSTGLLSVLCSTLVLGIACLLFVVPLNDLLINRKDGVWLMQLTIITAMIGSVGEITMVVLRADRRVRTSAVMNILRLLVAISVSIVLVAQLQMGLMGAVIGGLVGAIVGTTAQFYVTRNAFRFKMQAESWQEMIRYGLPFVPHRVQAVLLTVFGQFIVLNQLGAADGGLYRVAVMFAVPFTFVVHAVQKAWVPFKFQIHARDNDPPGFFRTAATYYFAGTTYLWVGVSSWGPLALLLFTDAKFHSAAILIPIVAAIPLCEGLYFMLGTGIEFSKSTRTLPLVSFIGLITVVSTAIPLVRAFGPTGAAVSTIIGWTIMAIAVYYLSQRQFHVPYDWPSVLGFLGGSSLCIMLAYHTHATMNLPTRIAMALGLSLAYPIFVTLTLLRSPTERGRMRELGKRLKAIRNKKKPPSVTNGGATGVEAAANAGRSDSSSQDDDVREDVDAIQREMNERQPASGKFVSHPSQTDDSLQGVPTATPDSTSQPYRSP